MKKIEPLPSRVRLRLPPVSPITPVKFRALPLAVEMVASAARVIAPLRVQVSEFSVILARAPAAPGAPLPAR